MGTGHTSGCSPAGDASANRVVVVPPTVGVEEATLGGLEKRMRSASRAEAQAAALRAEAAAEYSRRLGPRAAEKALRDHSGQSGSHCRVEVETALRLAELPVTRAAFSRGEISYAHARIIAKAAGRGSIDEGELVDAARRQPVDIFARTVRHHERKRSGDDGVSRLRQQREDRCARIRVDPDDGMTILWARFDPVTGAEVKNIISAKSSELWRGENSKERVSAGQRMADALAELVCRPGSGDQQSPAMGTTLLVIAHYDEVLERVRDARLGDGTPIPVRTLKELACRGRILPAIFDSRGQPLWAGRSRRVATPTQRMLLIARDGGCIGCGADPAWCQAHHIIFWRADGRTDIDNMCLLCSRCHHQIHDDGWEVRRTPGGRYVMSPPDRPLPPAALAPGSGGGHRKSTTKLKL